LAKMVLGGGAGFTLHARSTETLQRLGNSWGSRRGFRGKSENGGYSGLSGTSQTLLAREELAIQ